MTIEGREVGERGLAAYRGRFRSDVAPRHLEIIQRAGLLDRALHVTGDLDVAGDLVLPDAGVQVLLVDGDLTVAGRLEDRDDEENESLVLVGGGLRAHDLVTFGTLEVLGDARVSGTALFLDNACATHIEGNLHAHVVVDQYHHVAVGGEVHADVVVVDSRGRIEAAHELAAYEFVDDELAAVLVREVLDVVEEPEARHGFCVDWVDVDAIRDRVRAGRGFLRSGWEAAVPQRGRRGRG